MGRDKALLAWGAATLLDHTLDRLRQVCDDVRILCGPQARYADRGVPVEADVTPDAGSLGGVYTGLLRSPAPLALFLGVDLPLVPVDLLGRLIELGTEHDAVVPVSPSGPEPLCAVYARSCEAAMARRIRAHDFKMTSFWPDVRVREVGPAELAPFGDPAQFFCNVNSPEDYERALRGR